MKKYGHCFLSLAGLATSITLVAVILPDTAYAHEAYVLEQEFFWDQIKGPVSMHALDALKNHHNLVISAYITAGIIGAMAANVLFHRSQLGRTFHHFFEKFVPLGWMLVRLALALSFFYAAASNNFLGPEIPLSVFADYALLVKWSMYAASLLILLGLLTEVAAVIGLVITFVGMLKIGPYALTYLHYLGALIVLLLFGTRSWSLDRVLFGQIKGWRERFIPYQATILRVFYGLSVLYAAITVKLLHPEITYKVATDWNLMQFHWLFPSDPLLIVLGACLTEIVIGIFIILAFELRLVVVISLFYMTLSFLFFREMLWPHLLMYAIFLNLLFQPEIFTLNDIIYRDRRRQLSWWKRPLQPHLPHKDSQPVKYDNKSQPAGHGYL